MPLLVQTGDELQFTLNRAETIMPIGSVVAWLQSYTGTPALPDGWMLCDGSAVSAEDSPYHISAGGPGFVPNLNSGGNNRFLRGATSSGAVGGSETHCHIHTFCASLCLGSTATVQPYSSGTPQFVSTCGHAHGITPLCTCANSTLPTYYNVVWIIRIT